MVQWVDFALSVQAVGGQKTRFCMLQLRFCMYLRPSGQKLRPGAAKEKIFLKKIVYSVKLCGTGFGC